MRTWYGAVLALALVGGGTAHAQYPYAYHGRPMPVSPYPGYPYGMTWAPPQYAPPAAGWAMHQQMYPQTYPQTYPQPVPTYRPMPVYQPMPVYNPPAVARSGTVQPTVAYAGGTQAASARTRTTVSNSSPAAAAPPPPVGGKMAHGVIAVPAPAMAASAVECCEAAKPCPPCSQPWDWYGRRRQNPHVYLWGEYVYLIPRGLDIPYAQPVQSFTPNQAPTGPVESTAPSYAGGVRAGIGIGICDKSVLQASFIHYRSDTSDTISIPAGGTNALRRLLTFGPETAATNALEASATAEVSFDIVDVDFKHKLICGPNFNLCYLIGARYARLEQSFLATYSVPQVTNVTGDITYNGFGARVGLDADYFMRWGFFTYGRGFLNLLVGRFTANYEQQGVFGGLEARTGVNEDRIVPILELEAGLGWSCLEGRFRISAGYSFAGWFNTLTLNSLVQGIQATNFTTNTDNFRDTLTFDGFAARVEVRW